MISQKLSFKPFFILHVLHALYGKIPGICDTLKTQNKPIFKTVKIAINSCLLRTKNNELKTVTAKNKPNQTHFNSKKSVLISVNLCQKGFHLLKTQYNRRNGRFISTARFQPVSESYELQMMNYKLI